MRQGKFRGNLFVANLPKGFTDAELAQLFDPFGIVVSAFLARDAVTHEPKGHGLVNVAPEKAAKAAVAALNGSRVGDRAIEVRMADPDMSITIPRPRGGARRPPPAHPPAAVQASPQPRRPVVVEYRKPRRTMA
jgi:RNA recognition motif-containing protein